MEMCQMQLFRGYNHVSSPQLFLHPKELFNYLIFIKKRHFYRLLQNFLTESEDNYGKNVL